MVDMVIGTWLLYDDNEIHSIIANFSFIYSDNIAMICFFLLKRRPILCYKQRKPYM